ncbi:MAG: hypothetical protein O2973_11255 [Gemmatimonadetes bacterium]|nr:hypothetical protein [Gemmatimonadota bacterium]
MGGDSGVAGSINEWCQGREWRWRAALLAVLVWQAARPLRDSEAWHVFRGINFGVHEFGHLFFGFGGEWLAIAGGSLMQILVPIGAMAAMYTTSRDWFGVVSVGSWLAASLADLAPYIADARAQELDLVSFSPEGAGHDWHFLLAHAGWLKNDLGIARGARFVAVLILVATVLAALALFRRMARSREKPATA